MTYQIIGSTSLTDREKAEWSMALTPSHFGDLVIPWTEAYQNAGYSHIEYYYLQVRSNGVAQALAVFHIIRKMDLSKYLGPKVKRFFEHWAKLGPQPLVADMAFLEAPLANLPGIYFTEMGRSESLSITQQVLDFIRINHKFSMLFLKETGPLSKEGNLRTLDLPALEFLPNMRIEFKAEKSLDEYLARINSRPRREAHRFIEEFGAAGGTIEVMDDLKGNMDLLWSLFRETADHHIEVGKLETPIPATREFFETIAGLSRSKRRVFLAKINGTAVAVALCVDSGETMLFMYAGLHYASSVPTRAYFNLYYAMIDYACTHGYKALELGAEAYRFKKKIGGIPDQTRYYFVAQNPFVRWLSKFAARNFAAMEGVRKDEA